MEMATVYIYHSSRAFDTLLRMCGSLISYPTEQFHFSSFQFILFALINHDYNNYNNNYAFGRQSRKLFGLFKGLP